VILIFKAAQISEAHLRKTVSDFQRIYASKQRVVMYATKTPSYDAVQNPLEQYGEALCMYKESNGRK
jgi:hypothetical protein